MSSRGIDRCSRGASWAAVLGIVAAGCSQSRPLSDAGVLHGNALPDLSGLAWIEGDLFLGIHDAKRNPEKARWPRVSLVRLPRSEIEGVTWEPLDLTFPGGEGKSSDMESASRVPGTNWFLFAESGQEGEGDRRIFFASYNGRTLRIESDVIWPAPVENVEAIDVCRVGQRFVFLYAERADSLPATSLRWCTLSLDPPEFGTFREVKYEGVDPVGKGARSIVALATNADGFIYSVSTSDSGNDDGPFRSVVWRIGRITADEAGDPRVALSEGERLATLDGLKVESIAVRETADGGRQLYVGTDDEHFGGIIRLLPGAR